MDRTFFSPGLMDQIRSRFTYVDRDRLGRSRIYFENAGGALALASAVAAVHAATGIPDNAGRQSEDSRHIGRLLSAGAEDAALFMNARTGTVFSGESTTANIVRIVEAVTAHRKGTNLVCTNLDHASLYDSTRFYAERHGLQWRVAPLDPATGTVPVAALADLVDEGTVLAGFTHASNISGGKNDAEAIVRAVRRKSPQAFVLVDGAQHAQHGAVDVDALGADAYVFAAYKAFSTPGVTFAWVGPRMAEIPHPRLLGSSANAWNLGTRCPAGFAAFSAAVEYLCWLGQASRPRVAGRRAQLEAGMQAIEAHEHALTERLLRGADGRGGLLGIDGVTVHGRAEAHPEREAVFAVGIPGLPAEDFVGHCMRHGVSVHDRRCDAYSRHTLQALDVEECVRVSLAHYNTPDEVDAFVDLVRAVRAPKTRSICHA